MILSGAAADIPLRELVASQSDKAEGMIHADHGNRKQ